MLSCKYNNSIIITTMFCEHMRVLQIGWLRKSIKSTCTQAIKNFVMNVISTHQRQLSRNLRIYIGA